MAKNTGLGKGLDALFSNNIKEKEEKKEVNEIINTLKITEIEPNREQPRRHFDEEALDELADSIKRYGVIQPIIVAKKDNYYEIVAGERRWRASKKAGLKEIPVIIRDDDAKTNSEIALIENVQREDLNVYEKASGIKKLIDEYSLTQQQVAEILGKSRSGIANTVRILNLDERVLELVKAGKIAETHCRTLLGIIDKDVQYQTALKLVEEGSTVKDIEKKIQNSKVFKGKDKKYEAIYQDIESKFQGFFGSKVRLDAGKRRGKIIIEYNSNDDLERLLDLIK